MLNNKKPQDLFLLEGISYVSFNKDFTKVALSKKDNIVYIYSIQNLMKTDTWKLKDKLEAHVQYVSGIDWNPHTNAILTCSYDKASYVWEYNNKKWIPSNVAATTKLGYLCCKWNNRGDKFCEGTSSKHLFIGYYNTESKWWMGRNIKLHKSSVVCCEIDPTSLFVLSGSTDLLVYVSSCYIPNIDDEHLTDKTKPLAQDFGKAIYEFRPNCWINSVTWNASGSLGFAAGQNSTIGVINYKDEKTEIINCKHSPVNTIIQNRENSFFAVCYDRNILEYEKKEDKWEVKRTISTESGNKDSGSDKAESGPKLIYVCRMGCFAQRKKENLAVTTKKAPHLHQSLISSLNIKGKEVAVTTDVSGFVKYWKL